MADRISSIKVAPANVLDSSQEASSDNGSKRGVSEAPLLLRVIDGRTFTVTITSLTVYALFGDDFRVAFTEKPADPVFYVISIIALLFFIFELVVNFVYKKEYRFGFYFTLDFFATLSLIPDIGWIWDAIVGTGSDQNQAEALKAGRASRAGSKAGRIVRIVRIIRMVRIVKLYKMTKGDEGADLDEIEIANEPSKVGKKLTELTTRRVIVLILVMLMVLPLFDGGYDDKVNQLQIDGLGTLHRFSQPEYSAPTSIMESTVQNYARLGGKLFWLEISGIPKPTVDTWLSNVKFSNEDGSAANPLNTNPENGWSPSFLWSSLSQLDNYRATEAELVKNVGCYSSSGVFTANASCTTMAYFDNTPTTVHNAVMSILKTNFVMLVLGAAVMMFTRDAERLVIQPIERMVSLVSQLAADPLGAIQSKQKMYDEVDVDDEGKDVNYETALLESTLSKIGALMQVGFGEAGAEIIAKNMQGGGEFDPMIPGKKVAAIFGFCDIRQFTDTTECLQEEVMVYVNKIGEIVHSCTHVYYGAANKNIGDAFLLAWKICDGDLNLDVRTPTKYHRHITPREMADSALTAFLKIIVELDNANSCGPLSEYLTHDAVLKRFGPGFRIKMGFGMHVGWAIEGAIGSSFKIDASYLSPNVNMAARLEAATKQFRTPLLLSHWFRDLLTPAAQKFCRRIDCVTVKGSEQPMTLYTYDVVTMVPDFANERNGPDGIRLPVDFAADPQFEQLQHGIAPGFYETFEVAVAAYIAGDWAAARDGLNAAMDLKPEDGPSVSLMEVLERKNFCAPSGWPGYRELTEK